MEELQSLLIYFFPTVVGELDSRNLLPVREQSKAFKAMLVLFLFATQSVIFVTIAKLAHRKQPYPSMN